MPEEEKEIRNFYIHRIAETFLEYNKTSHAIDCYNFLAHKNDGKAQYKIGTLLVASINTNKAESVKLAKKAFLMAIKNGYYHAYCDLGRIFAIEPTELDIPKAMECYQKLAFDPRPSFNKALAQNNFIFHLKQLDKRELAKEYLTKWANGGDSHSQYNLAIMFGEENNIEQAKLYYQRSAEQNHSRAQLNLGAIYNEEKNYKKAKYWWLKAAEKNIDANHNIGNLYNTLKKQDKAIKYYKTAADDGFVYSQITLGRILKDQGNETDAKKYYMMAAFQGNKTAFDILMNWPN
ncbi:MAG: hypothetical protein ACRYGR_03495 [Janthinobacterium lividum]